MRRATASFAAAALITTMVVAAAIALPGCDRQPAPPVATGSSPAGLQPAPVPPTQIRSRAARANVLIVSLDSARADHCGSYGYPRETTPCIDDLSRESVVFEGHFADYPETLASIASLFTGTYADTHESGKYTADYLIGVPWTLPAALHAAGYRTALFSAHPMVTRLLGDAQLFQTVAGNRMGITALGEDRTFDPSSIVSAVSSWLDEESSSPFFAYVHLMPPHHPYGTRDEYGKLFAGQKAPTAWQGDYPFPQIARDERENGDMAPPPLDEWVDRYDASLLWGDWGVGQLEALLREKKLLDNTILIVTSDHGEAFGEHGYIYHVFGVYDELIHVPLLIRLPGGLAHRRVLALTQTVDVAATVLDLLGMDRVDESQGKSLLPLMSGEARQVRPTVFARAAGSPRSYLVRTQDWALILYEGGNLRALYDLKTDPKETRNVLDQQPEVSAEMVDAFRAFASTQKARPLQFADPAYQALPGPKLRDQSLDTELRRDLKALGYL